MRFGRKCFWRTGNDSISCGKKAAAEGLTPEEEQEAETTILRSQQKVHNPQSLRREQTVEEMMAEIDNLPSE